MTVEVVAARIEADLSAADGESRLLYTGERPIRGTPRTLVSAFPAGSKCPNEASWTMRPPLGPGMAVYREPDGNSWFPT